MYTTSTSLAYRTKYSVQPTKWTDACSNGMSVPVQLDAVLEVLRSLPTRQEQVEVALEAFSPAYTKLQLPFSSELVSSNIVLLNNCMGCAHHCVLIVITVGRPPSVHQCSEGGTSVSEVP